MNLYSLTSHTVGAAKNVIAPFLFATSSNILYVSDPRIWAIGDVGSLLSRYISPYATMRNNSTPYCSNQALIHFGSEYSVPISYIQAKKKTKKFCLSLYHIASFTGRTDALIRSHELFSALHTSCSITASHLIAAGVDPKKIITLPLGVDRLLFVRRSTETRSLIRKKLRISPSAIVLGSFQKDGVGWGKGMEPKLIKGPDLFVQALARSSYRKHFHVLLSGPARGYVKQNLELLGIPYTHVGFVRTKQTFASFYHALDAYVITSRLEGAPLQLCEAWASGVPLVSTRVGMVQDYGKDRETVLFADFNSQDIARAIDDLIASEDLSRTLTVNAAEKIAEFDWRVLARAYYEKLYRPLIS